MDLPKRLEDIPADLPEIKRQFYTMMLTPTREAAERRLRLAELEEARAVAKCDVADPDEGARVIAALDVQIAASERTIATAGIVTALALLRFELADRTHTGKMRRELAAMVPALLSALALAQRDGVDVAALGFTDDVRAFEGAG